MYISLIISLTLAGQQLKIVDGDTIWLNGEKIRLEGIDAPEMDQPCFSDAGPIECGARAKQELTTLTTDHEIKCTHSGKDRYQRFLSECFAHSNTSEHYISLNHAMVATGWAVAYRKYSDRYIQAEEFAKTNKLGIWSYQFEMPWDWRRRK